MTYTLPAHSSPIRRSLHGLTLLCAAGLCLLLGVAAVRGEQAKPVVRFVSDMEASAERPLVFRALGAATEVVAARPDETVELLHSAQESNAPDRAERLPRVYWMNVSAYCPCTKCCGKNAQGITASGKPVTYAAGRFVAADTSLLPFGTRLHIPGYHDGAPVEVIDRGGAIKGLKLDVFFATHEEALQWGRRSIAVTLAD